MKTDFESLKKRFDELNNNKPYGAVFESMLKLLSELHEKPKRAKKNEKSKELPETEASND